MRSFQGIPEDCAFTTMMAADCLPRISPPALRGVECSEQPVDQFALSFAEGLVHGRPYLVVQHHVGLNRITLADVNNAVITCLGNANKSLGAIGFRSNHISCGLDIFRSGPGGDAAMRV